ncbi:VOC family protein [Paenibacillus caui]|uniref:VOC family protein n=1 Tax=Paenibacillus caui TaxID=2873927 RepID=UPI001CA99F0D|nr:VOC family protein [Paenibacillus caui]
MLKTAGIHHITAYVNDVQAGVDFYAGLLGLRLIKQTIHFDAHDVYHLYFGNESGHPGTIVSFLLKEDFPSGRIGSGQVGVTVYAVPSGSLLFWRQRLKRYGVDYMEIHRFGEDYLRFTDNAGLLIDLVERGKIPDSARTFGGVPGQYAIKGLDGALLFSKAPWKTATVLEDIFGLTSRGQEEGLVRYEAPGETGCRIDLNTDPIPTGIPGAGVVRHIAWRARNESEQLMWQDMLGAKGFDPSPAVNLEYYKSVYFREPGGILFQVATDSPGFQTDETAGQLGSELMLPESCEAQRGTILKGLKPFRVRELG